MGARTEKERIRLIWERIASGYDRAMRPSERFLFAGGREWVCSRARGDVLEVSVGTGVNLRHYPPEVRLAAVDISARMIGIAAQRAAALGRAVDLRVGDAEALEFPDASFDTVVCTLALCSIPDPRAAVTEMRRVLRPGGRVLALEHGPSSNGVVRALQRAVEPLALRLFGDHLVRETARLLGEEGFAVEEVERSKLGIVERVAARKARPGGG